MNKKSSFYKFVLHAEITKDGNSKKVTIPMHSPEINPEFFLPDVRWCVTKWDSELSVWQYHSSNCYAEVWEDGRVKLG